MEIFSVYLNFLTILTILTVVSGVIVLFDSLAFKKRRLAVKGTSEPVIVEYSRSFFPIFLFVLVLRSFFYEGYRIPSGSLEPTLQIGDIILVNKYSYGLHLPVGNKMVLTVGKPQVGDIVVFEWPPNRNIYMIKRVIGVPGDVVEYKNNVLYINEQEAKQQFIAYKLESSGYSVAQKKEDLVGKQHDIFISDKRVARDFRVTVPKGHYFMMGDNRSLSSDSRYWGFMSEDNIVGKAVAIVVSWNSEFFNMRWDRTFNKIQ